MIQFIDMLEIPETHRRLKVVIGISLILLAFLIVAVAAALITDRQRILVGIVCAVSTIVALSGSLLLIGRND